MTFRFGLVAATASSGAAWAEQARRAEDLGFDVLLVPDTMRTLSPFPALAAAAAATTTLRVGTYVLSAPNRTPAQVVWETTTLQQLSDGRFELGIGGGRPDAAGDAEALGRGFGPPGERVRQIEETLRAVRELDDPPPILVAASRPRILRLAAELASTVALGLRPSATEKDLDGTVATLRDVAGSRLARLELHVNVAAVAARAADVPPWVSRMVGGDPQAMAAAGGIGFLLGTPNEIAATLRRRQATLGISYVAVNGMFAEQFAPVIAALRTF